VIMCVVEGKVRCERILLYQPFYKFGTCYCVDRQLEAPFLGDRFRDRHISNFAKSLLFLDDSFMK
jgi:hypothetical protein